MALGTPGFSFTYGSRTVDGSAHGRLVRTYVADFSADTYGFECFILVKGSSASDLQGYCASLEADLVKVDQDLAVTLGGQTQFTWAPSTRGLLGTRPGSPTLRKLGDPVDSPRTRLYHWRVEYLVSATVGGGTGGLLKVSYNLSLTAARRRSVVISGEYTATAGSPSKTAQENYDANCATFCNTLLGVLSSTSTWKLEEERQNDPDDTYSKVTAPLRLEWERTYVEQLATADPAPVSHASIFSQEYSLNVTEQHATGVDPVEGYAADGLDRITVAWSAEIARTETDLRTFFETEVWPTIYEDIQEAAQATSGQAALIEDVSVTPDAANSRLAATIVAIVPGGSLVEASFTVSLGYVPPWAVIPRATGRRHDFTLLEGESPIHRVVTGNFVLAQDPAEVHALWAAGGLIYASKIVEAWAKAPFGDPSQVELLVRHDYPDEIDGPAWVETDEGPGNIVIEGYSPDGEVRWTRLSVSCQQRFVAHAIVVRSSRSRGGAATVEREASSL